MFGKWFAVAALPLAACGCSHVITASTPYYNDGPEQLDPPQGEVPAGAWVLVVGERNGYYHILTAGVNAFVWKNDVMPLLDFRKQQQQRQAEAQQQEKLQRAGLMATPPPASQPARK